MEYQESSDGGREISGPLEPIKRPTRWRGCRWNPAIALPGSGDVGGRSAADSVLTGFRVLAARG